MKNILFLLIFPSFLFSQVNYSEDISPIIYNNCTECHRDGQAGPMSFTNYSEVSSLGVMIKYVTQSGYMPPWHADPDYSTFLGNCPEVFWRCVRLLGRHFGGVLKGF